MNDTDKPIGIYANHAYIVSVRKAHRRTKMSYADFKARRSIGDKMLVGESYTLKSVSFTPTKYGDVAVFETEAGKRYSGATAIVDDARFMLPEDFPMTVKVVEVESANGRKYQTFE